MKRARQAILVLCIASFSGCRTNTPTANFAPKPTTAQESPIVASVTALSLDPLKFDGRLVVVRARLALGWEGDNFLFEPSAAPEGNTASPNPTSVWLYCKPGNKCQPDRAMEDSDRGMMGTFVGYFHFVPDPKWRRKDVFDPGPFQLEGIGFSIEHGFAVGVPSARKGGTHD